MKLLLFSMLEWSPSIEFRCMQEKEMLWLKEYMHYHDISHILFFICIIIVYRDLQCICND